MPPSNQNKKNYLVLALIVLWIALIFGVTIVKMAMQ